MRHDHERMEAPYRDYTPSNLRHDNELVETPYRRDYPPRNYREMGNQSSTDHAKYRSVDYYEKEREEFASRRYYSGRNDTEYYSDDRDLFQ